MTPERQYFNEVILPKFIKKYVGKNTIIDVGKPNDGWGYRQMFNGADYRTLDRNADLNPDILDDMENTKLQEEVADIIICNGVMEQCDNPFKLVAGLWKVLKIGGHGLFGIMSVGFPMIQDLDLCRFTPQGVDKLLRDFKIIDIDYRTREVLWATDINADVKEWKEIPSYIFVTVQK